MGLPTVTPFIEVLHDGGFIVSEASGHISRDTVTITGATKVLAGTVLGQQTTGTTAIAAALGANTGNGTFGAIAVGAGALPGAYTLEFADATHFAVASPLGVEIGHGVTGVVASIGGIGFTVTAGATPFAPADSFTIAVAAGSLKYAPLNLSATDGTAIAVALLFGARDATTADKQGVIMARSCEVNASELVWPAGITALQIATAATQLRLTNVISR